VVHNLAFAVIAAAAKGLVAAGHALGHALAANPDVALGKAIATPLVHLAATHPAVAALTGAGVVGAPIVTVAYLDVAAAKKQLEAAAGGVSSARTVKISVAGNFFNGVFTTITGPFRQGVDHVMVANYDEGTKSLVKMVVIKPDTVESRIANALASGNVAVLA
jgi:hypothetical protein